MCEFKPEHKITVCYLFSPRLYVGASIIGTSLAISRLIKKVDAFISNQQEIERDVNPDGID